MARRFAAGSAIGICVCRSPYRPDVTMAWKDGIVSRLRGGVYGLLRRAKVKVVSGTGICVTARRASSRATPARR